MRRIVRSTAPTSPEPLTPSRALRQAITRAASQSIGLPLTVLGVSEEVGALDDILTRAEDGLMLLALGSPAEMTGFLGIDLQTRAAVIEVQTLGRVSNALAQPRPATAADIAMAEPFVQRVLHEIELETAGTLLDGWVVGQRLFGRFAGMKEVGLTLANGDYRVVRLTLDLGAGGRQGLLVLALPMPRPAQPTPAQPDATAAFSRKLSENILVAPAEVRAILHRMRLPLRTVEVFELGQTIPLWGATVTAVKVEAPDGRLLALARLGQMSGMRAVRLGPPARPEMTEVLPLPPGPA
jgi:flagellar motor switch protein FliM